MRISERRLRRIIRGMIRENIHPQATEAQKFAAVIYEKHRNTISLDNIDEILASVDLYNTDFNDSQAGEEELRTALVDLINYNMSS
jgi:hypothetical protein